MEDASGVRSARWGAFISGLGLGGFFDGIVLHQLLQWHHMVCRTATCQPRSIEELQFQNFTDGLFHAGCLLLTSVGLGLLIAGGWRGHGWSPRVLTGLIVAGWGAFNLVEGLIDHQILGIHHVRPGADQTFWDMAFLAWGLGFVVLGSMLARSRHAPSPGPLP